MRKILFIIGIFIFFYLNASQKSIIILRNLSKYNILKIPVDYFTITKYTPEYTTIIATEKGLKWLKDNGFKYEVLVHDIEELYIPYRTKFSEGSRYHTYNEVVNELKSYHNNYPNITHLEVIGTTYEGRKIYALKISDNPEVNEDEPAVLYMGLHHAREWISTEIPIAIIDKLLKGYNQDNEIKKLVNNREIWVVPLLNPDGLEYSQFTADWRKNRKPNGDGTFGVDLNRNYGYKWGLVGASNYPGSGTYMGPSAFSELETKTIRDLAIREKFIASISYHSYGQLILYPWSYTSNKKAPDYEILSDLAKGMSAFNGYKPIQSAGLYPAAGDSDDWLYSKCSTLSFTIELGSTFVPPEGEVDSICDKNVKAALYLLKRVGNLWPVIKHKPLYSTVNTIGPYNVYVDIDFKHNPDLSIGSFKLFYRINNGVYNSVDFEKISDERFVAKIPGQEFDTRIDYYILLNNTIRSPEKGFYSFNIVRENYLIVDDDKGKNYETYVEASLKRLNYAYQIYNIEKQGVPDASLLRAFTAVIWITGDDSTTTITKEEEKILKDYLESGGSLLISGQDIGYDIHSNEFYSKYLKAKYLNDNSRISNIEGELLSKKLNFRITGGVGASNQRYPDVITAINGGKLFLRYVNKRGENGITASSYNGEKISELNFKRSVGTDNGGAGIYFIGKYKLIYLGFGIEGIKTKDKIDEFLKLSLEFLEPDKRQLEMLKKAIFKDKAIIKRDIETYKMLVGRIYSMEE